MEKTDLDDRKTGPKCVCVCVCRITGAYEHDLNEEKWNGECDLYINYTL